MQIDVSVPDDREMTIYRTDGNPFPKRTVVDHEFLVILGQKNQNQNHFQYLVAFENGMPDTVTFYGKSITKYAEMSINPCFFTTNVFK